MKAPNNRSGAESIEHQDRDGLMNLLGTREIADVQLLTVEVPVSELNSYSQLLLCALKNLRQQTIARLLGNEPHESEGLLDHIENILEEAGLLALKNQKTRKPVFNGN